MNRLHREKGSCRVWARRSRQERVGGWGPSSGPACVEATDHDRVHISLDANPEYMALLQKPMVSPVDGQWVYLEKTGPEEAFPLLAQMYSNDYFFVTEAHDEATCLFRHGPSLGMKVRFADSEESAR